MSRGGAIKGEASAPLPEYPSEQWTCSKCGSAVAIALTPNALRRGWYKCLCGGAYRPEPGREECQMCSPYGTDACDFCGTP